MRPNKLRELLRAGRPSLGTHIHSAWPATIELAIVADNAEKTRRALE